MIIHKSIAALGAGCVVLLGAVALAQTGGDGTQPADGGTRRWSSTENARINWINKSSVAALREGVIEQMELQIGMPVKKNGDDRRLAS